MKIVTEESKIVYNECQEKALERLAEWAISDVISNITLEGFAGTGKSTVVGEFVRRNKLSMCVSAPTHKAKKVISRMTGMQSETLQSLLGLKPSLPDNLLLDFDGSKLTFEQQSEPRIRDYKIIIVDEASMISKDLYDLLVKEAADYKSKILFVGDRLQLPPVKENISKAFTSNEVIHLTTIVRQEDGNPLLSLLGTIRNDILDGTENFRAMLHGSHFNSKGEGYATLTGENFQRLLIEDSKIALGGDPNYCKVTAWTNTVVTAWNSHIREKIITNAKDEFLYPNEILLSYNSVYDSSGLNLWITNSEEYRVLSVAKAKNLHGLDCYKIKLENVDNGNKTPALYVVHPEQHTEFFNEYKERLANAKRGSGWNAFYTLKRNSLLLEDIQEGQGYKKVKAEKSLDYAYALTVHKTQGSTYNNIYVIGANLNRNPKITEQLKLWYVALSRCTTKAYILL